MGQAFSIQYLSRAAGKLFYVFGEGLGTELETFHHGEIGKQLIGQILNAHAVKG